MAIKKNTDTVQRPPDLSIESRQNRLISLAFDEAERRIEAGTASSQMICHFLKMGSTREEEELAMIRSKRELVVAQVDALDRTQKQEMEISKVMDALKSYSGGLFNDTQEEDLY